MKLKELARTGMQVSEIGMGTYYDPLWIAGAFLGWKKDAGKKVEAVSAGLEAGVTLVDTAEIYRSEPLVAKALLGRKRDELFVATKVWSNHLHADSLVRAFNGSLARLGLSYIDLYQVHWPNPRVPIRETMGAMEGLVQQGKLRHIGVSNFNLVQLKEAQSALSKVELTSVQLDYSLVHRNVEREILPYCQKERIALLAYYPLGHGKLISDPRLGEVSAQHQKSKGQIALRWLARQENVFPIPRASQAAHVSENAAASGWEITDADAVSVAERFPARA